MLQLPLASLPAYNYDIEIESIIYNFTFLYNSKFNFWTMDIRRQDLTPIILGVKLVLNYNLRYPYAYPDLFTGNLYLIDETNTLERVGIDDLSNKCKLIYVSMDELNAII